MSHQITNKWKTVFLLNTNTNVTAQLYFSIQKKKKLFYSSSTSAMFVLWKVCICCCCEFSFVHFVRKLSPVFSQTLHQVFVDKFYGNSLCNRINWRVLTWYHRLQIVSLENRTILALFSVIEQQFNFRRPKENTEHEEIFPLFFCFSFFSFFFLWHSDILLKRERHRERKLDLRAKQTMAKAK